jgi:hypothetical protein
MPKKSTKTGGFLPRRSQRIAAEKKKRCLANFTRQRPTVLDEFPLFVIEHHIVPYLDYQTRISLNQCLPIWDRLRTKMAQDSVKKHHMDYCVKMVASILGSLEERDTSNYDMPWIYRGDKRIQRMIEMLGLFLKEEYFAIYTSSEKFRRVFREKIDEIQALTYEHNELYSKPWLEQLASTCNSLRDKILNYNGPLTMTAHSVIPSLNFT